MILTVDWNRASQRLAGETLTDPKIRRLLNQGYIVVLVNADLRPDIRERYQTGAWPAMAWLLPNGQPMLSEVNEMGRAKPITTSEMDVDSLSYLLHEGLVYWGRWRGQLMEAGRRWTEDEGPEELEPGTGGSVVLGGDGPLASGEMPTGSRAASAQHPSSSSPDWTNTRPCARPAGFPRCAGTAGSRSNGSCPALCSTGAREACTGWPGRIVVRPRSSTRNC